MGNSVYGSAPPCLLARSTHPLVADELLVAHGLVGLEGGHGAGGGGAVAEADVAAPVVVPALVSRLERALFSAARTLQEEERRLCGIVMKI